MNARLIGIGLLALGLPATVARAEIVPVRDVTRLVNNADVIVVGMLTEVTDLGVASLEGRNVDDGASGRLITGRIVVRQVLKGRANERIEFWSPVWRDAIVPRDAEVIVLLTRLGAGMQFVSPYYRADHIDVTSP